MLNLYVLFKLPSACPKRRYINASLHYRVNVRNEMRFLIWTDLDLNFVCFRFEFERMRLDWFGLNLFLKCMNVKFLLSCGNIYFNLNYILMLIHLHFCPLLFVLGSLKSVKSLINHHRQRVLYSTAPLKSDQAHQGPPQAVRCPGPSTT